MVSCLHPHLAPTKLLCVRHPRLRMWQCMFPSLRHGSTKIHKCYLHHPPARSWKIRHCRKLNMLVQGLHQKALTHRFLRKDRKVQVWLYMDKLMNSKSAWINSRPLATQFFQIE